MKIPKATAAASAYPPQLDTEETIRKEVATLQYQEYIMYIMKLQFCV